MSLSTLKIIFIILCIMLIPAMVFSIARMSKRSNATYTVLTQFETYTGMTRKYSNIYTRHNGLEVMVSGSYTAEEEPYVRSNR